MATTGAVDIFLVYQFLKRLAMPFERWEAYKTGVIDKEGNIITPKNKRDQKQNNSFATQVLCIGIVYLYSFKNINTFYRFCIFQIYHKHDGSHALVTLYINKS